MAEDDGQSSIRGLVFRNLQIEDTHGHGMYVRGNPQLTVEGFRAARIGGDAIHIDSLDSEAQRLISALPPDKQPFWAGMFQQAAAGTAGGLGTEALKGMLITLLKSMGLN